MVGAPVDFESYAGPLGAPTALVATSGMEPAIVLSSRDPPVLAQPVRPVVPRFPTGHRVHPTVLLILGLHHGEDVLGCGDPSADRCPYRLLACGDPNAPSSVRQPTLAAAPRRPGCSSGSGPRSLRQYQLTQRLTLCVKLSSRLRISARPSPRPCPTDNHGMV